VEADGCGGAVEVTSNALGFPTLGGEGRDEDGVEFARTTFHERRIADGGGGGNHKMWVCEWPASTPRGMLGG